MNFEVNDVTAKILDEFQEAIDNALGDIKDKQEAQQDQMNKLALQDDLQALVKAFEENQKQITLLEKQIGSLNESIETIKTQLGNNESLLKRIVLRPRRLR